MPDLEKLLSVIDAYEDNAYGSEKDGGELSRQRALALDSYAAKNIEPGPKGTSQVVDWTPFECVQQIMPSMIRIFAGGDNIVEFDPVGPEDEEVAEQESDYLNHLITQRNDWEKIVREWCQDALITKNAYCYAFMDEKLEPEIEVYEGQSEEQVAMLLEDDVEIIGQEQRIDEENPVPVVDPMTGQPAVDPFGQPITQPRVIYDLELRKVKATKKLCFKVLPPERCKIGQDTTDYTLEDCDYFEYWDRVSISDLRKMGYDIPDDINDDPYQETEEDVARDEVLEQDIFLESQNPDKSTRRVICRWIWVRHDYDEDGIAELQFVLRVGREVLEREEVSRIPVASIVPFVNTHRHMGTSVVDAVFDIWRIKTFLLREGLNGLALANRPRHVVSRRVTIDDMLTSRAGAVIRLNQDAIPGEGHVMPLQTENTFPYAQQGLLHMDTVKESRIGVGPNFTGIDAESMTSDNAYNKIGQLSTMAAQRVEDIARVFGQGFKRLFSIAHELIIKSGASGDQIKLRGKWTPIDPTQWRTGRDMRVVAPFAAGNKDSLIQRLMVVKQAQMEAIQLQLPVTTPQDVYELDLEIAKAADVQGNKFFTDPEMIPPPPEVPDHTLLAIEVENKKADNEAQDEARKAEIEVKKIASEERIKEFIARLNAETQIYLAQIKAGQAVDLESVKANFRDAPVNASNDIAKASAETVARLTQATTEAVDKISEALSRLDEKLDADRELVRDDRGNITGSRRKK